MALIAGLAVASCSVDGLAIQSARRASSSATRAGSKTTDSPQRTTLFWRRLPWILFWVRAW